ncbi:MAG: branched-chain amino acid aminotransferase/4-amino-4-deoxychorismate lyase [Planctomycetota bacterium]|nr:branched-chain amino acid aminotransferase/4-amino-4-deoxychorismate lyase [Planctomycetota bacterium]
MEPLACLNGEILPAAEAKVSIWDRGFLFGDSIYEVMRLYSGRMWIEEIHFARLRRSLREMQFPSVDLGRMRERIGRLLAAGEVREGTVYIQVTRGVAPRLHAFPDPPVSPTELIVIRSYEDGPTALLRESGVAAISQPDLRWKRRDVKSTNLLGNVLANEAAHRNKAYEAILVDDGIVTEATHSSLLWVREGRLEATPEGHEILPGTTRAGLSKVASGEGLPIQAGRVTLEELLAADEVILTGTTIEVLPVVSIDGHMIGGGRPGPVARRLQSGFRTAVANWLATPEIVDWTAPS